MHSPKVIDPIHQFELHDVIDFVFGGIHITMSNGAIAMLLCAAIITVFTVCSVQSARVEGIGKFGAVCELIYMFLKNTFHSVSEMYSLSYFSLASTVFFFVFVADLVGMIPNMFTATSQLSITFLLALIIFISSLIIGFVKHGMKFLRVFCPSGMPIYIAPIVVPIEICSFFFRPISLALRLFANMLVGHILIKIVASFVLLFGSIIGIAAFATLVCITLLEFLVAALQAYVFFVLTCVYFRLSMEVH